MAKTRTLLVCSDCGQQLAQWAGRCPGCGSWGTIEERPTGRTSLQAPIRGLSGDPHAAGRASTGFAGVDRVLGGGLIPASVVLLAGEPGIGKSTLLLQMMANLSAAGLSCLLASGEETADQVGARARRLGLQVDQVGFVSGRDLETVLAAAEGSRSFVLALDSIQAVRGDAGGGAAGGASQVRACADALVGMAKASGVTVVMTGHVTKDGDIAGPRTLEHAVDVVVTFEGDPRSGLRTLSGGKNRFGQEGEMAWFEMAEDGLREIDPASLLSGATPETGCATALFQTGRRAIAVDVQALVLPSEGPPRRQVSGLDQRRFQLIAAVLDGSEGFGWGRWELYGASSGAIRIDDPAVDLAVAASLASARFGQPPPADSAFVGEIGLTGAVRPATGMMQRMAAARAAGRTLVFAPYGIDGGEGLRVVHVGRVGDALGWCRGRRT